MIASSMLLIATPIDAQSTPVPQTPEFILRIADHSYDVPSTTISHTDPWTGNITTYTQPGYHVTNRSIEVAIKNQPFTPYVDAEGNTINLYYNISVKPRYGGNWTYYPHSYGEYYNASTSEYTIREFGFGGYADTVSPQIGYVTPGGEVDFRVQAQVGYYKNVWVPFPGSDSPFAGGYVPAFYGESSQWSGTQTIKTPEVTPDVTASPSPSPTIPEMPTIAFLILTALVPLIVIYYKKHSKSNRA
ncbi:hypothetical protein GX563_02530 [Candidatus Bathyarchaeota archaeon]|nr:hypothetical protein [Candidatus Bathyarchaeota archaeon]